MIAPSTSQNELLKNNCSTESPGIKTEILDDGFNQLVATDYSCLESSKRVLFDVKTLRTQNKDSEAMRIKCSNVFKTNFLSVQIENGNIINSARQGCVDAQGQPHSGNTSNLVKVSSYNSNNVVHQTNAVHPLSSYSDESKGVTPPRSAKSKKKSINGGRSTDDKRKKTQ